MTVSDLPRPADAAPRRACVPLGLAVLFLLSLPAVTPRIYASDEIQYFAYLRSLWFDRDVSFENEYRYFYDSGTARSPGFHETFLERTTEAGRRVNFATIGCALLWSPFYAVGDLLARALRASGRAVAVNGYSWPYVAAVSYASAFYGAMGLGLAIATARRLGGTGSSLAARAPAAALGVWFGTPLLFYMYVAPPMSHATSAFAVSLFVFAWVSVRDRWTVPGMVVLGVLAALMAMVREQDAFVVAGPAVDGIVRFVRTREPSERPRLVRAFSAGLMAGLVAYVPQALAYVALNGHLGPSRLVARKMTWTAPHALQVLASPGHGFLVWTPLAAIALAGLAWLPRTAARARAAGVLTAALAIVTALQVYVAGSVESWTVAGAFGQRRFVALTPLLVVGLAAGLAGASARARRVALVLVSVAVWWNLGLVAQFGTGLMNRQRIEPARVAYNSFVVLPQRLPELAWRYLFDRASFYDRERPRRGGVQ